MLPGLKVKDWTEGNNVKDSYTPMEYLRVYEALKHLVGVIESHECRSPNCNGTEDKYCNCLDRATERARTILMLSPLNK